MVTHIKPLSPDACAVIEYALRMTVMREDDATALLRVTDATYVENAEDTARVNTMRTLVDVIAGARTIYVEF